MSESTGNQCSPLGLFPGQRTPRFYDHVVEALSTRQYRRRTEEAYLHWIRRYLVFHSSTHPRELAECDVNRFLTHLVPSARTWPRLRRIRRLQPCCLSTSTCCLMSTRTDFIQVSLNKS